MVNKIKKIRYVLKNKITGSIEYKYYYLEQIEKGIEKLFDVESYEIISRDRCTGKRDEYGKEICENDISSDGLVVFSDSYLGFFILSKDKLKFFYANNLKIIGDIHQNPELLGR